MAAATTDARHEFVTASVGLVHLRSVPVVSESGQDGYRHGKASISRRRKPKCYRALSGVSFQNSVDVSSSDGPGYDEGCWEMDRDQSSFSWTDQNIAPTTSTSPAGTVRVTFVHRTITDYSSARTLSDDDQVVDHDEELVDDDDEDYDQSSASVSVASYRATTTTTTTATTTTMNTKQTGALLTLPASESALADSGQEHIYDTPCSVDELYSDLLSDSDLSGLDLSIFEPGRNSSPTSVGQLPKTDKKGRKAFIYRPPRPQRQLSRGKTFRERLAKPLQKFFHVPTPPAVDYKDEQSIYNNEDDDDHHVHQSRNNNNTNSTSTTTTTIVSDLDHFQSSTGNVTLITGSPSSLSCNVQLRARFPD